MTRLHEAKFTPANVAAATGVPANTIRTWNRRGLLLGGYSKGATQDPAGIGLSRLFSAAAAIQFAIIAEFVAHGASADEAAKAAFLFVHTDDNERAPYALSDELVILSIHNDGASVFNHLNQSHQSFLDLIQSTQYRGATAWCIMIEVSSIVRSIIHALNIDLDYGW